VHEGLRDLRTPILGISEARNAAEHWARRDPSAVEFVNETLETAGRSLEEARALTLRKYLKDLDTLDRLLAGAEARRASVLREVDRRRAAFALALRSATKPIEEAEFSVIERATGPRRAA
jgi:hypothetical protein